VKDSPREYFYSNCEPCRPLPVILSAVGEMVTYAIDGVDLLPHILNDYDASDDRTPADSERLESFHWNISTVTAVHSSTVPNRKRSLVAIGCEDEDEKTLTSRSHH